jgi:hypothetical protein
VQIASGVTARVRNVIYHHKFQRGEELPELRYILFGKGPEIFVGHVISRPPDYDQLVSVDTDSQFSDEDLRKGIIVKVGDRPNTIDARIKPGVDQQVPAVAEIGGTSQPIQLQPKVEFYFETGDLEEAM